MTTKKLLKKYLYSSALGICKLTDNRDATALKVELFFPKDNKEAQKTFKKLVSLISKLCNDKNFNIEDLGGK